MGASEWVVGKKEREQRTRDKSTTRRVDDGTVTVPKGTVTKEASRLGRFRWRKDH